MFRLPSTMRTLSVARKQDEGTAMALTEIEVGAAAQALHVTWGTRRPVLPPSRAHPSLDLVDGYRIAARRAELAADAGAQHVGWKVGLTSRAMQQALGADEPQFGWLQADRLFGDGEIVPTTAFLTPKLEIELAFTLGMDLTGPGVRVADVLRATDTVQPALEIVDYRTEVPRTVADMVADNTAGAGAILGGRVIRPFDADLRCVGAALSRNGVIEESGVSAAVMGHPAAGVAVLANRLAALGRSLRRGEIVLAGSFTRQVVVAPGDIVHADYGQLGAFAVRFA